LSHVGLSELLLLFVIGLLILGPERLPRVASQIGRWVGRARRTANQLRYQLEREITLAEHEKTREQKQNTGATPTSRPDTAAAPPPKDDVAGVAGVAETPPAAEQTEQTEQTVQADQADQTETIRRA
jgi:sec-independent protein translocase protein TatB